ncbi:MAG: YihY/virulence factor BrkB family protein [Oscillospiraceae bacterium]|nr:YihY/virulence factor BrkB family protein [Oscillospiraceae bacterium]
MKKRGRRPLSALGRIAGRMVIRYYDHDVARDSAALTYYLLFAIFPLLIVISMLLGALALDVEETVKLLSAIVPPEVLGIVRSYLDYVSGNTSAQLLWFCVVFSIWFPMRATSCLMHSVRKAYGCEPPKSIWHTQLRTLVFAVLLIITIALTALLSVAGRRVLHFISRLVTLPDSLLNGWNYLRFAVMALMMAAMLAALHMLAVGRRLPLKQVLPGISGSLAAWMLLSAAFSYYVENFAHYTELYGSIATIVVALLWLYMSGQIQIMGAELNGALQEDRVRDAGGPDGEDNI